MAEGTEREVRIAVADAEQPDLVTVIGWLADQPWCNGSVGMWGTSYSGFNALQVACERPPALKAVCAIYSSDDRWTDDVLRLAGAVVSTGSTDASGPADAS